MLDAKYYVTTTSGLEDVTWEEINTRLKNVNLDEKKPGQLSFTYSGDHKNLLRIRSAEDIYVHIGTISGLTRSRNSLGDIFRAVSSFKLDDSLLIHKDLHGGKGRKRLTFRIYSSMASRHNFRRVDAQNAAVSALTKKYNWKLDLKSPALEFQMDLEDDVAQFGLKLTDERLRRWGYKVIHLPASLKPSIAQCMVLLSKPIPEDIFVDPMCGAGTIAIERAFAYPYQRIIAGDVEEMSTSSAKGNIHSSRKAIDLMLWNASTMPIKDQSVDKLVSNLPFGKLSGSHTENQYLYAIFFREMKRIMKIGSRAVLLTTERDLMRDIVSRHRDVKIEKQVNVELSGLKACIYVLNFQ